MSEQSVPDPKTVAETQAKLRELASTLRTAGQLDPQMQQALADLLDELGAELNPGAEISAHEVHLAEAAHDVAHSVHEHRPRGLITTAKDRLQEAATRVEVDAPVMTGVVNRLVDLLASMGI